MAKSIAGVAKRPGQSITIGDNRYGMREAYDEEVNAATKEYYREGDTLRVTEIKNPLLQSVKTSKP
jgi:hypothetical protein